MIKTPGANRMTIGIFGKRNAGKSQLMNCLTGQNVSVVSPYEGTTTDPVKKAMELLPVGPILLIDTAGIDDNGELGILRVEKTKKTMERTDFAVYVIDATKQEENEFEAVKSLFKRFNIPYLRVYNKLDQLTISTFESLQRSQPKSVFISAMTGQNVDLLQQAIIENLQQLAEDPPLISDLLPYDSTVILVVPIDSEAPKGRLILPQVQTIRECLDNGIKCHVVRDAELGSALKEMRKCDLVITDSQAFGKVDALVPKNIKLTSFSILFARQKGNLELLFEGEKRLRKLKEHARILISEACTHNVSCEDIGRVKIPTLLEKRLKKNFSIEVIGGKDFPENLSSYDLVIHCGGCMLNRKGMQTRLLYCRESKVPVTNYGMALASLNGIFDRATELFK
ncbi:MAG: [FeFe] hydrogenase H-cluster maturation GTPase HydF [Thermotogota bacterium]|nr:[FeFe] hydrogenase H-cluster maturation GTPase HydF [Thermotogota bacterium]